MRSRVHALLARFFPKAKIQPAGKLCCEDCRRQIHRYDRYVIVSAKHRNCADPKLVGQQSFEEGKR
jgi:hypothetical protein